MDGGLSRSVGAPLEGGNCKQFYFQNEKIEMSMMRVCGVQLFD